MAPSKNIVAGLALLAPLVAAAPSPPKDNSAYLLVSHFSGPIYSLELTLNSPTNGSIAVQGQTGGCGNIPGWITLDEKTDTLYCFDEDWNGSGVISQYKVDKNNKVTITGSAPTTGNKVFGDFYGGRDGKKFIATSEYSPSTISTYKLPITADTKPIQVLEFTMAKPGPRPDRQDRPHPHASFTDPTGNFLIVPDLGADLTRIFKINKDNGILTACPAASSLPGDGPRHGVFRKVGCGYKYYSLNEVSSGVGVYDVVFPQKRGECLQLALIQTLSTYGDRAGKTTEKAAEIHIAGDYLYASNRGDGAFPGGFDSLAIFKIAEDGSLTFQELTNSYGVFPRFFVFNKAQTLVAIGGQTTANVAVLGVDLKTGKLGPLIANAQVGPKGTYGGEDGISNVIWNE